jgi:hypothetical protein
MRRSGGRHRVLVVAFGAAGLVASCTQVVGPARTARDYELKATNTVESVRSSVETARLVVRLGRDGDAFAPYLSVLASEAEDAASAAHGTFSGIQPPDRRADALRRGVGDLLDRADAALGDVRIRARRTQLGRADAPLAARLARIARDLERFEQVHG